MALPVDIRDVRANTDEPEETTFTDEYISGLIDVLGVAGASAELWRKKAAACADLVNTSEAGSSRSLSDLQKNALAMVKLWEGRDATPDLATEHPVSRRIVRP